MDLWLPGARVLTGDHAAGLPMNGLNDIRRVTWHITWDKLDPRPSFDQVARYLVTMGYEPTLMWNPEDGDLIQFLPADRGAYALVNGNKDGDVNVQIETYFSPGVNDWQAFTDGPMVGADRLMAWLDQLGIPRSGPMVDGDRTRNVNRWRTESGHFGHVNSPGDTHTDPAYQPDYPKLFAAGSPLPTTTDGGVTLDYKDSAITKDPRGVAWITARGADHQGYLFHWNGTLWVQQELGGALLGSPAIAFDPVDPGRLDFSGVGVDSRLYHAWIDNKGHLHTWELVGGAVG